MLDVTATDIGDDESNPDSSSIIDNIYLFTNSHEEITCKGLIQKKDEYIATFELKLNDDDPTYYTGIYAKAVDIAGNVSSVTKENVDSYPSFNDDFEIVITEESHSDVKNFKVEDKTTSRKKEGYSQIVDDETRLWFSDHVEVSFSVENTVTKIGNLQILFNGDDITKNVTISGDTDKLKFDDKAIKNIDVKFELNGSGSDWSKDLVNQGANTVEIRVWGNNGVYYNETKTFYVDSDDPNVDAFKVELDENSTVAEKILRFLTFGIYSNSDLIVTVEVSDKDPSSSSGIESIVLYDGLGRVTERTPVDGSFTFNKETGKYEEKFKLPLISGEATDYKNIHAVVYDYVGNYADTKISKDNIYISEEDLSKSDRAIFELNQLLITDKNIDIVDVKDGVKIEVIDSPDSLTSELHSYIDIDKEWHYGDVEVKFSLTDNNSGINSLKLYLNDAENEITDKAFVTSRNEEYISNGAVKIDSSLFKEKITHLEVSVMLKLSDLNTDGDGDNVFYIVAENNSGVEISGFNEVETDARKNFYVDSKNPDVANFKFEKSVAGQILQFLTFGIFSDNTIYVTITVYDPDATSGINDITLANGDKTVEEKSGLSHKENYITKKFALDPSEGTSDNGLYNSLKATVIDNVGHKTQKSLYEVVYIDQDDKTLTNDTPDPDNYFDVIVDSDRPIVTFDSDKGKAISANSGVKSYIDSDTDIDETEYKYWYSGDVTINFNVKSEISNIQKVDVTLNSGSDGNVNEYCKYTVNEGDKNAKVENLVFTNPRENDTKSVDSKKDYKVSDLTITFNTADINDKEKASIHEGKNTLKVVAYANNGKVSDVRTIDFYIDTERPEIVNIEFKDHATSNILSFITFGVYHNNDIDVVVTIEDHQKEGLSSGIKEITLKNGNGTVASENIDPQPYTQGNNFRSFTLKLDTANSGNGNQYGSDNNAGVYNDLQACVTDRVQWTTGEKSIYDIVYINSKREMKNETPDKPTERFEVVTTKATPEMETIIADAADKEVTKTTINGVDWYSGDVKFEFGASAKKTKLRNIAAELNGVAIKDTELNEISIKTDKGDTDTKQSVYTGAGVDSDTFVESVDVKFNTENVEKIGNEQKRIELSEGENSFKVTAQGNNGVYGDTGYNFMIDTTTPVITAFRFRGSSTNDNGDTVDDLTQDETRFDSNLVEVKDYGYFFKQKTTVFVTADDGDGSGVKEIYFYAVPLGQSIESIVPQSSGVDQFNQAHFDVNANFKGEIYAYAVDMVNNGSDANNNRQNYRPEDLIVEDENQHKANSFIHIEKPETSNKDINGIDLYNSTVPVTLTVSDTYSGIKKIEYSVTSPYDTQKNFEDNVVLTNNQASNNNLNGWSIDQKDRNIATQMSKVIDVENNSNSIVVWVKLTDRAGNTSEEELTFSIDTTAPTIEIVYDNNSANVRNDKEYYKADRTATITIAERNFSEADVDAVITNTFSTIPSISSWEKVDDTEDSDNTKHIAKVTYSADGDYTFDISFKDLANNEANKIEQHKFTIDKTLPVITVTFDNNSAQNSYYYKADRTATIKIVEHNFDSVDARVNLNVSGAPNDAVKVSSWNNSGDNHTATIMFNTDGLYSFTVGFTDLALNDAQTVEVPLFYIDKTAPKVVISNIENNSANAEDVIPIIDFEDENFDSSFGNNLYTSGLLELKKIDITGNNDDAQLTYKYSMVTGTHMNVIYDNFPKIEENDGIYSLKASYTDLAGNSSEDEVTFSVNRFGSTYIYGDDETKNLISAGYTNQERDIVFTEINVNRLMEHSVSMTVNGESVTELKEDKHYSLTEVADSSSWHRYDYTVFADNFVDEGIYTLTFSSTDEGKHNVNNRSTLGKSLLEQNTSRSKPVSFVIDKTAPVINIYGLEDNKQYYDEDSIDVKIVCEDLNIDPSQLVIKLNNEEFTDYEASTENPGEVSVAFTTRANVDNTHQSLEVSIKDLAGNQGDKSIPDYVLSATWLMLLWANKPLFFGLIAVILGLIAGTVIIIRKKRSKGNDA